MRDVTEIGGVKDTLRFGKFLTACAAFVSEQINYKTLADITEISQPAVKDWLQLLDGMGNQGTLHDDVKLYFNDLELLKKCDYTCTVEKARGGIEKREYWQTDDTSWLPQKSKWKGLKSIGITKNTIFKEGIITEEIRYFISSLKVNCAELARCIRGHWVIESFHWHLDVTFREDANQTLEKHTAFNLNIMNKIALSVLKIIDLGMKPMSLKKKRYTIFLDPLRFLNLVLSA